MKLSELDSNSSSPRMMLPAALFPDPDRPSMIRRSSGVDDGGGENAGGVEDWDTGEGEAAKD